MKKIDGTNASVYVPEDGGPLLFGSRTRWITPENDNAGFARWATEHAEELRGLGPGHHFGEWWGAGIQRRYGLTGKRFSLFNVHRWTEKNPPPPCCNVVPVLGWGPQEETVEKALAYLRTHGSVAAPGFMDPEGIVVFHTASRTMYKVTLKSDDKPKGSNE